MKHNDYYLYFIIQQTEIEMGKSLRGSQRFKSKCIWFRSTTLFFLQCGLG